MGATNRPNDVDGAILRRMPAMFIVRSPNREKRLQILQMILEHESVDDDVDLDYVASVSQGFSGSDLKELCRTAAMYRAKELSHTMAGSREIGFNKLRPISNNDFIGASKKMKDAKGFASKRFESEALD